MLDFNLGSEVPRPSFSEALELLAFLSESVPSGDLGLFKRVFITPGSDFDPRAIAMHQSVREQVSALPFLLADPSIKSAVHLTSVQAARRLRGWGRSGSEWEVAGEVMVAILSISRPDKVAPLAGDWAKNPG